MWVYRWWWDQYGLDLKRAKYKGASESVGEEEGLTQDETTGQK